MGLGIEIFEGQFRRRDGGGWVFYPWLPFVRKHGYGVPSDQMKSVIKDQFGASLRKYQVRVAIPYCMILLGFLVWCLYEMFNIGDLDRFLIVSILYGCVVAVALPMVFYARYRMIKPLLVGLAPVAEPFPVVDSLRRSIYYRKQWVAWVVVGWCCAMGGSIALLFFGIVWERSFWFVASAVFLWVFLGAIAALMVWLMLLRRSDRRAGRFVY